MIPIAQKARRAPFEVIHQIWYFVKTAESGESGLFADVGVPGTEAPLHFGDEIARHFFRTDVGEGTESERDGGGVGVVHVTGEVRENKLVKKKREGGKLTF